MSAIQTAGKEKIPTASLAQVFTALEALDIADLADQGRGVALSIQCRTSEKGSEGVSETTTSSKNQLMQLCVRRRDRAAAVAYYRRLEETLWRELELLPRPEICLLYEIVVRGG